MPCFLHMRNVQVHERYLRRASFRGEEMLQRLFRQLLYSYPTASRLVQSMDADTLVYAKIPRTMDVLEYNSIESSGSVFSTIQEGPLATPNLLASCREIASRCLALTQRFQSMRLPPSVQLSLLAYSLTQQFNTSDCRRRRYAGTDGCA